MRKLLTRDDNKDILITISAVIKARLPDCSVITAQSGAEGIKKAKDSLRSDKKLLVAGVWPDLRLYNEKRKEIL